MPFTNKEWIESFTIFDKYADNPSEEGIHKSTVYEVFAGPNPEKVSTEDKERLDELGWSDFDTGSFHAFI